MALQVVDPGMFTTVQDRGRFGYAALGVSAAGAADPVALRVGNVLAGNDPFAPALEMTLRGGTFVTDAPVVIAWCGSDFEASAPPLRAVELPAGGSIRFGATRGGARCTLCVRGGVAVPSVLGSASTHVRSGLGGIGGRALRRGDVVPVGVATRSRPMRLRSGAGAALDALWSRRALRVVDGPITDALDPESRGAFFGAAWRVAEEADRMGLRLRGPALSCVDRGERASAGVGVGAIQVPPGGDPIVLFVDQQTTGGYPRPYSVILADAPALAHARPRDELRFLPCTLAAAREALSDQERMVASLFEEDRG